MPHAGEHDTYESFNPEPTAKGGAASRVRLRRHAWHTHRGAGTRHLRRWLRFKRLGRARVRYATAEMNLRLPDQAAFTFLTIAAMMPMTTTTSPTPPPIFAAGEVDMTRPFSSFT